jgi:dTMP kinase
MGRLIVFEGTDGSGKATQCRLLGERLARKNVDFRTLDFPRYGQPSCAPVELYLHGELGKKPGDVNAYAASTFYAVDRYASYKQDWGAYYEGGGLLLADRYTTSNAVHQTAKMPPEERGAFLDWLFHFEYTLLELPKPDLVFYLDLPTALSEKLLREREAATHTAADIHEADAAYLQESRAAGLFVAERCRWQRIDCAKGGKVRTAEDISEEIYARAKDIL